MTPDEKRIVEWSISHPVDAWVQLMSNWFPEWAIDQAAIDEWRAYIDQQDAIERGEHRK